MPFKSNIIFCLSNQLTINIWISRFRYLKKMKYNKTQLNGFRMVENEMKSKTQREKRKCPSSTSSWPPNHFTFCKYANKEESEEIKENIFSELAIRMRYKESTKVFFITKICVCADHWVVVCGGEFPFSFSFVFFSFFHSACTHSFTCAISPDGQWQHKQNTQQSTYTAIRSEKRKMPKQLLHSNKNGFRIVIFSLFCSLFFFSFSSSVFSVLLLVVFEIACSLLDDKNVCLRRRCAGWREQQTNKQKKE